MMATAAPEGPKSATLELKTATALELIQPPGVSATVGTVLRNGSATGLLRAPYTLTQLRRGAQ